MYDGNLLRENTYEKVIVMEKLPAAQDCGTFQGDEEKSLQKMAREWVDKMFEAGYVDWDHSFKDNHNVICYYNEKKKPELKVFDFGEAKPVDCYDNLENLKKMKDQMIGGDETSIEYHKIEKIIKANKDAKPQHCAEKENPPASEKAYEQSQHDSEDDFDYDNFMGI